MKDGPVWIICPFPSSLPQFSAKSTHLAHNRDFLLSGNPDDVLSHSQTPPPGQIVHTTLKDPLATLWVPKCQICNNHRGVGRWFSKGGLYRSIGKGSMISVYKIQSSYIIIQKHRGAPAPGAPMHDGSYRCKRGWAKRMICMVVTYSNVLDSCIHIHVQAPIEIIKHLLNTIHSA